MFTKKNKIISFVQSENFQELQNLFRKKNSNVTFTIFKGLQQNDKSNILNKYFEEFLSESDFSLRLIYARYFLQQGNSAVENYIGAIIADGDKKQKITALNLLDDFRGLCKTKFDYNLHLSLHDKNTIVVMHALKVCANHSCENLFEVFKNLMKSKSSAIRNEALIAISKIMDSEVIQIIIASQFDKHVAVRKTARKILSNIESSRIQQKMNNSLVEFLKDEMKKNTYIKGEIIDFIKNKKVSIALPLLHEACSDKYKHIRLAAVQAISVFKDPQSISLLIELANDKYFDVRIAVIEALKLIPAKQSITAIEAMLTDSNFNVRKYAESALYSLKAKLS